MARARSGEARVRDGDVEIELDVEEGEPRRDGDGVRTQFAWTRKQAGVPARGAVSVDGAQSSSRRARRRRRSAPATTRATRPGSGAAGVGTLRRRAQRSAGTSSTGDPRLARGERAHHLGRRRAARGRRRSSSPTTWQRSASTTARARLQRMGGARGPHEPAPDAQLLPPAVRDLRGRAPGRPELAEGYGVMEDHEVWWSRGGSRERAAAELGDEHLRWSAEIRSRSGSAPSSISSHRAVGVHLAAQALAASPRPPPSRAPPSRACSAACRRR